VNDTNACEVLRNTIEAVAGLSGKAYFEQLVLTLAASLGVRHALVGELREDGESVDTLAVCSNGRIIDDLSYPLDGSPCGAVVQRRTCLFSSGVQKSFPDHVLLQRLCAESYLGTPLRKPDGEIIGVLAVIDDSPLQDNGAIRSLFELFAREATGEVDRLHNERALSLSAAVFHYTGEGILVCDAEKRVVTVNRAYTRITGFPEDEVRGRVPLIFQPERYEPSVFASIWESVEREGYWQGEVFDRRRSGEVYTQWLSISRIDDENRGASRGRRYVAVFSDISGLKQAQERLSFLAHHDPLTGLPNRTLMQQRVQFALSRARRKETRMALLFIDLDRFKVVNDTLGHAVGDELLKGAARRLVRSLREVDVIARLGGDEFIVLVEDIVDAKAAAVVAEKIQLLLSEPFLLQHQEVVTTSSIGISLYPADGHDLQTLLKNADMAMYQAKEVGRNGYQFFKAENNQRSLERLSLEAALRRAPERGELLLHYQPVVDVADGRVVGVEALVRWRHPDIGLVSPVQFVPLAEETGLIVNIGAWVLEEACRQTRLWHDKGHRDLTVAVNLSPRQFRQAGLQETVRNALWKSGLNPHFLELEITEGVLMQNVDEALRVLESFDEMGIHLLMDDFGTGYSSLSYLKRFPIHTLKIDRSFVSGLPGDADDAALAGTIVAMAHALKLDVIAEGVEKIEQLEFLREQRCERYQGFLFSAPKPADEIEKLLQKR
jgi:diguanylate cyclase (GGDEF)-like protein/PAS domain S-box-containing protein